MCIRDRDQVIGGWLVYALIGIAYGCGLSYLLISLGVI